MNNFIFNGVSEFKLIDLCFLIPNYLNKKKCEHFINIFENSQNFYKEEYVDFNGNISSKSADVLTLDPFLKDSNYLNACVKDIVSLYKNYLHNLKMFHVSEWDQNLSYIHSYRILRYNVGEFIDKHSDYGVGHVASCVINFNDNYEGGDFVFFNGQYSIKLGLGDAMIFPADFYWLHNTNPILKGKRYSFNCFLCDAPKTHLGSPYSLKDSSYENRTKSIINY